MLKKTINFVVVILTIALLLVVSIAPGITTTDKSGLLAFFKTNADVIDIAYHEAEYQTTDKTIDFYSPCLGKSFHGFKEALAFKESRGDYFVVNTLGYLGKYQFGVETLKLVGVYNPKGFLQNSELQERAFLANTKRNKWILRKDIKRFVNKKIGGVEITESGILAAAHLAGPGSVKKFLRSYGNYNVSDAYGATVKYYLKKFSGYDTSIVLPKRNAKV